MLRLHFLGVPLIEREGRPVQLPAKSIALLAYLASAAGDVPRERILGLLWAESAEEAARKNLRNILWTIGRELGEGVALTAGDRLALAEAVWVDISFPEAAPELYRGPFLDGLILREAPEFELWMTMERERLAQNFLRVTAAAIRTHRAHGAWRDVLATAQRGLAQDILHEPFHCAVMEAHARLGERAEALRQYEMLRALLERELGVEPLPETENLRARLLTLSVEAPAGADTFLAVPTSVLSGSAPVRATAPRPFIGRSRELAVLSEEFSRSASGETRVVLISGELGIGKSRLWQEWSAHSLPGESGLLEARCLEATHSLPFAPLTELFASDTRFVSLAESGRIPLVWLAEAARLLPQLRSTVPSLPPPAALPAEEERRRVFETFTLLLMALEMRPLVIFLDDVHWIDHATLDWLAYLVHRLRDRGLLLVLTYRPEEMSQPLRRQIAAWVREGRTRRIPLARLNRQEASALMADLRISPHLVALLHAHSAGNPYFLLELGRNVSEGMTGSDVTTLVPTRLADLIRARLDGLPESVRQVVQAAAILEPDFDMATLRRTGGRSEEETLDAIDALLAAGILADRPVDNARASGRAAFEFAHPLVATVIRYGLSTPRRAFLHRRAAHALEVTHRGQIAPVAGRLFSHYRDAGEIESAARYADLAALHALSLTALAEATHFLQQAVAFAPTPERRMKLGDALYRHSELAAARTVYEAALAQARAEGNRAFSARACLGMAQTFLPGGRADDVVRWAERSLQYLEAESDPTAHAQAHYLFGAGRLRAGGAALTEAEGHLTEAVRLAEAHGERSIASISRFELGNLLAERGDLAGAIQVYEKSIQLAETAGEFNQQVLSHNNAAYHAMLAGDLGRAHGHIAAALELADRLDLRLPRQFLYSTRGEIALAEGQWDEAETWLQRSLAEAKSNGNVEQQAKCHANMALAARGRGDLDTALSLLHEAATLAAPLTARFVQTQIDLWLAEVQLAREAQPAAREALERAEARLSGSDYRRLAEWAARVRTAIA